MKYMNLNYDQKTNIMDLESVISCCWRIWYTFRVYFFLLSIKLWQVYLNENCREMMKIMVDLTLSCVLILVPIVKVVEFLHSIISHIKEWNQNFILLGVQT